jgi:hypothetical protein
VQREYELRVRASSVIGKISLSLTSFTYAAFLSTLALAGCKRAEVTTAETSQIPPVAVVTEHDETKLTAADLIDKLATESEEGVGYQSATSWSGFSPIDEALHFEGGILGSPKPKTSSVMRELVSRGATVLPELIKHIDDNRETHIVVANRAIWHSNEYDPRSSDPKNLPTGLALAPGGRDVLNDRDLMSKYTLRVGDLCFVAIGQIVNRNLFVARYQHTMCFVLSSPVHTPELAAAVKRDWAGLTIEQHKKSLMQDALTKFPSKAPSAIVRLLFYYPKEGEDLVLKLLSRPLYNRSPFFELMFKHLRKTDDLGTWAVLIMDFRKKYGVAMADELAILLEWHCARTFKDDDEKQRKHANDVKQLLVKHFPGLDFYASRFINGVNTADQASLIEALEYHRSQKIDQAVREISKAATQVEPADENDRSELNMLIRACQSRFARKAEK